MPRPIELFFSYAHEDESLMDEVRRQLVVFDRQGLIRKWHDRLIPPGADWRAQIDHRLAHSDVILLFVSPDFFESDYCYEAEMTEAMRRHWAGSARVVPIILRPCAWRTAPFADLEALPKDGRPITMWPNRDEACLDVAEGVMRAVRELRGESITDRPRNNQGFRIPAARFRDDLWLDPVSIKVVMNSVASGSEIVYVNWPSSTQTLIEATASVADDLREYDQSGSSFHNSSPDWVASAYQRAHGFCQYAKQLQQNVPIRIPLLWKGMKEYFIGPSCERALGNFVALANFSIQLSLALFLAANFPTKREVISPHLKEWLNISWPHRRNVFKCLFGTSEPIFAAEILAISKVSFNHYVYGPKSKVLEAYCDSKFMNRPIINGWFADQLIPQIELIISEGWNNLDSVVEYCEEAYINKVRDENEHQVDGIPTEIIERLRRE
jgi:hypothetical protein